MEYINRGNSKLLILFLVTCLLLLHISKLSLIEKGFLTYSDEYRYVASAKAFQYFSKLEIRAGLQNIFSTQGRPADPF